MKEILKIAPIALYMIVGVISMVMAFKSLLADKYLTFHEKAAGKTWNEIEGPLKHVILSLLKLGGLGFLIISILLIVCPVVNYFIPCIFDKYAVPSIALVYCAGLFVNNFLLYRSTKADTPWKGSLYAVFIIAAGIVISVFNR